MVCSLLIIELTNESTEEDFAPMLSFEQGSSVPPTNNLPIDRFQSINFNESVGNSIVATFVFCVLLSPNSAIVLVHEPIPKSITRSCWGYTRQAARAEKAISFQASTIIPRP